jgi:putative heme transporter
MRLAPVVRTLVGSRGAALRLALRTLVLALAVYLLLPNLAGLEESGRALARARIWWLGPLVLTLEAASLLAYAELVRTVLRASGQPVARGLVQRATFAGYALGRTLPGGSMAALAVIVTELRGLGFASATTAAGLAACGLLSAAVLVMVFPLAALLALIGGEGGGVVLGAAGLGALAVFAAALAARPTLRRPEALGRLAERATVMIARGPLRRHLDPAAVGAQVTSSAQGLGELAQEPALLRRAGTWAAANWLLDLAVLVAITVTLGPGVPLWGLPLAYVLGQWTASVPLTPGGVGLVEPAMTAALVAAGVPGGVATASVLGWRLISHWIPILVGLVMLPTLRRGQARDTAEPDQAEQRRGG